MRASGWTAFVVDGAEANGIDHVQIERGIVRWTVTVPTGVASTLESADPAVIAFVRAAFNARTSLGPGLPTSAASPAAPPPDPA